MRIALPGVATGTIYQSILTRLLLVNRGLQVLPARQSQIKQGWKEDREPREDY